MHQASCRSGLLQKRRKGINVVCMYRAAIVSDQRTHTEEAHVGLSAPLWGRSLRVCSTCRDVRALWLQLSSELTVGWDKDIRYCFCLWRQPPRYNPATHVCTHGGTHKRSTRAHTPTLALVNGSTQINVYKWKHKYVHTHTYTHVQTWAHMFVSLQANVRTYLSS